MHPRGCRGRDPSTQGKISRITSGRAYIQQGLTTTCKDCGSEPIGRETQRI